MGGLLLRIGIIGAIAGGLFLLRDLLPRNATDLAVGNCFDAPTTADETVEDVDPSPCTDPHTAEVFYVADYTASTTYPDVTEFDDFSAANCPAAFQAYTGMDFYGAEADDFDIGMLFPLQEGWDRGQRKVSCYIVRADRAQMSASLKKT